MVKPSINPFLFISNDLIYSDPNYLNGVVLWQEFSLDWRVYKRILAKWIERSLRNS